MYYRDFNANVGTESTITIDGTGSFTTNEKTVTGPTGLDGEIVIVAPASEISIEAPLNRVNVTYDQKNLDQEDSSFLKNGCFGNTLEGNFGNVIPNFWDFIGYDPSTYLSTEYDGNGNGMGEYYHTFNPSTQGAAYLYS